MGYKSTITSSCRTDFERSAPHHPFEEESNSLVADTPPITAQSS